MNSTHQSHAMAQVTLTPINGFLILMTLVVVIGAFLVLNHILGLTEVWAAFLFLLYWGGIDHAKMETLPACIIGAVLGLLLAASLRQLPLWLGNAAGFSVFLAAILILVYCQIMGWLKLAVNMMTMLFLTVGTIPLIQRGLKLSGTLISLAVGIAYFAGLVWAVQRLQKKSQRQVA